MTSSGPAARSRRRWAARRPGPGRARRSRSCRGGAGPGGRSREPVPPPGRPWPDSRSRRPTGTRCAGGRTGPPEGRRRRRGPGRRTRCRPAARPGVPRPAEPVTRPAPGGGRRGTGRAGTRAAAARGPATWPGRPAARPDRPHRTGRGRPDPVPRRERWWSAGPARRRCRRAAEGRPDRPEPPRVRLSRAARRPAAGPGSGRTARRRPRSPHRARRAAVADTPGRCRQAGADRAVRRRPRRPPRRVLTGTEDRGVGRPTRSAARAR